MQFLGLGLAVHAGESTVPAVATAALKLWAVVVPGDDELAWSSMVKPEEGDSVVASDSCAAARTRELARLVLRANGVLVPQSNVRLESSMISPIGAATSKLPENAETTRL